MTTRARSNVGCSRGAKALAAILHSHSHSVGTFRHGEAQVLLLVGLCLSSELLVRFHGEFQTAAGHDNNAGDLNFGETSTELDSAMARAREPFTVEDGPQGRTLVVTGPWSTEAARLLSTGDVDGLHLNYEKGFSEDDLSFFAEWPLRRLQIVDRTLVDLGPIGRFADSLEELSVRVSPEARLEIGGLQKLHQLSSDWRVLRPLSGRVHTLESLVTWNFDGSDFRPLNNYSRLKNLAVREAPRLQSLRGINVMNSLSALNLHLARQLSDISDLAESGSTLNKLSFDFCSRIGRLDALRSLRRLRLLGVSDCKRIESLAPLGQLTQLEVLHGWGSTRIVDGNLSLLLQLPRLREVRMKSRIEYRPSVDEITTAIRRGEPVDAAGKLSGQVHERLAHDEGISE